jgi:oxalate decarboxylase/phosphoglucose isomerase-like protein (cupin superfamily)
MKYGITDQYYFHFFRNITNTNVQQVNIFYNRNNILTKAPNGHGRKYQLTQQLSLSVNVYENLTIRHIKKTETFLKISWQSTR